MGDSVINTEKLSFIDTVQHNDGLYSVNVGAGVISQLPSGMTIFQDKRLSIVVPHFKAFLPPAFIATLPN
jgi:hypothetical protein